MSTDTLIRATTLQVSAGLELLDTSDALVADISDNLVKGSVSRNNLAKIHGTAKLTIAQEYEWGSIRLRPTITLTDLLTGETQTWNMGVFLPNTPDMVGASTPAIFEVECYDKLAILDTPYGASYFVLIGAGYVDAVETLLDAVGEPHSIDQTSAAKTLPHNMAWPLDDKNTYLQIANDLLGAIGYQDLYVDRNGIFRSDLEQAAATAPVVFNYDTSAASTIISDKYSVSSDLFDIPNKWAFVNDNPAALLPTEGDGVYTVTNQSDGATSIDARGRTITRIVKLDAADQASLVSRGDRIVEADKEPTVVVKLDSSLNPEHWHRAVVTVDAPEVGIATGTRFIEQEWSANLGPEPMSHTLRRAVS